MEFATEIIGEKGYVTVSKDLDSEQSAEALRIAFAQVFEQGKRTIVFDLRGIQVINSFGLGKIITCYKKLRQVNGTLMVKLSPGYVRETFELLMLDKILPIEA